MRGSKKKADIKVAFIEETAQIGGAEVNLLNLLRGFSNVIRPVVICPHEGPLTRRLAEIGAAVEIVPRPKLRSTSLLIARHKLSNPAAMLWDLLAILVAAFRLRGFLTREGIDLVHTNSMLAHFYGGLAGRMAGVPVLWHLQDIVEERQLFGLVRRAVNWGARHLATRVVVVSRTMTNVFDGALLPRTKVIYNGIETEAFRRQEDAAPVRKELGFPAGASVVGIIGRLVHWKGHRVFLQAASRILDKQPNTRFLIIGDTSFGDEAYADELKTLASKLQIDQKVQFLGFRKDIIRLLSGIDIVVHASTAPEPFGLVITEAMAAGKPVVATALGGVPEIVIDGQTGVLVKENDPLALASSVIELIRNPEIIERLGQAAQDHVQRFFSLERFCREFVQTYVEIVPVGEAMRKSGLQPLEGGS